MDDIKKILSDLKSMAAFAKEEAEDIKFRMDSINEILQQNLKLLVEISTSHAKVTNDINDRIDALEAQLRSTDTNKYEQVDTNENKQVQMKEDPQCGSSSGPKRDAIIQSPRKVTINENHTRTVRIQPDEDDDIPLLSKEEEYENFAKVIYEIKFNDSYFISPGEHIYPRIVMMKGADPLMVKMSADYGFLDLIYPDRSLKEIEKFDEILKSEISKYAQGGTIYLKFYTISPEVEDGIFYPAEHIITIGHVGRNFTMDVGENDKPLPKITKTWIKNRRILGYKVLYYMAKNLYEKNFRCICQYNGWILLTNDGKLKSEVLKEYINKFDTHQMPGSISTIKRACEARDYPTCRLNRR
ncbi:Uncharacterized protein Adt_27337 [Abeliophyllum distichum]|uniref:Uncharacterized protein n=1 Tax=Abeliophyllum distichum TaxID=126358 RepID=A0ABD1RXJ2_9LAMI